MAAVLVWFATIGIGLVLVLVTASLNKLAFHAFICALISINFVILALREHERPLTTAGEQLDLLGLDARFVGGNWLWMSLAVIVMQLPRPVVNGPMLYAVAGLLAAALCLGLGRLMVRSHTLRPTRIALYRRIAGVMALLQLAGACATLCVLIAGGLGRGARYDWPSVDVIAFGTVALGIISARALLTWATPLTTAGTGLANGAPSPTVQG